MAITTKPFGTAPNGEAITLYTLTNAYGASISAINYGAILTSIIVPDKNDVLADVALGFDSMEKYGQSHGSMGDTVGRYGNRIKGGHFTIDGVDYQLDLNNGPNCLHGGLDNMSGKVWTATTRSDNFADSVSFRYVSPDGESHFPGTLDMTVTYSWTDNCDLIIRYEGTTDKATLCNMTNHTYFNLAGHDHGTVLDHVVMIDADTITPVDEGLIPLGTYMPVSGTAFDMRGEGILIGEGIELMDEEPQMQPAGGYDHNFVLNKGEAMASCAWVLHEESGRFMEVLTDQPAVQLYTACTTDLEGGKNGAHYKPFSGLCLETQHCPDSPNNPQFPGTTVLRPGEKYDTTTIYAFRVVDDE